jgi:hypothetical protein
MQNDFRDGGVQLYKIGQQISWGFLYSFKSTCEVF